MTKETKYGIIALIAIILLVPIVTLSIKAISLGLLFIMNHPLPVVSFIIGAFTGDYLKGKLK